MKLWSLLEFLSGARRHSSVVKRVAVLASDEDLRLAILDHLRKYRNQVVHEGRWRRDAERLVCELRLYVAELLQFHVAEGRDFVCLEDAGAFLDLPSDLRVLKKAVRFFGHP